MCEQLQTNLEHTLPAINDLESWLENEHVLTCSAFQDYRQRRQQGGKREYFPHLASAFEFLIKVAPTKQVDGAWLYSLCHYIGHPQYYDAIKIYLEELGNGQRLDNHVCMFNQLLQSMDLDHFNYFLEGRHYLQGAIQLALAYAPAEYLPMIIGFNLAYEQLPLHLLITNDELKELGIDHRYFNVHITIDNLDNGHAYSAFRMVELHYRHSSHQKKFMQQLSQGYQLANLGVSSSQIVQELDMSNCVERIILNKARIGKLIHNNRCKFAGQSINEWLTKDAIGFLNLMQSKGMIRLQQHPNNSTFWNMINEEQGKMAGVFGFSERQFISDWIMPDDQMKLIMTNIAREPLLDYTKFQQDQNKVQLQHHLDQLSDSERLNFLIDNMAPHRHFENIGLYCTQIYANKIFPYLKHKVLS